MGKPIQLRAFILRHAPLLSMVCGGALSSISHLAWRSSFYPNHQAEAIKHFDQAVAFANEERYALARDELSAMHGNAWRHKGVEGYQFYLRGVIDLELAEQANGRQRDSLTQSALTHFQRAEDLLQPPLRPIDVLVEIGTTHYARGEIGSAYEVFRDAFEQIEAATSPQLRCRLIHGWLQCFDYQHREDIELADQLTAAAIRELADEPELRKSIQLTRAEALLASGQADQARQLLDTVVPTPEIERRYWLIMSRAYVDAAARELSLSRPVRNAISGLLNEDRTRQLLSIWQADRRKASLRQSVLACNKLLEQIEQRADVTNSKSPGADPDSAKGDVEAQVTPFSIPEISSSGLPPELAARKYADSRHHRYAIGLPDHQAYINCLLNKAYSQLFLGEHESAEQTLLELNQASADQRVRALGQLLQSANQIEAELKRWSDKPSHADFAHAKSLSFLLEAWRTALSAYAQHADQSHQLTRQLDLAQLVGEWSRRLVALRELKLAQSLVGASESIMRPGESDKAIAELIWLQLAQRNQDPDGQLLLAKSSLYDAWPNPIAEADVREYWSNAGRSYEQAAQKMPADSEFSEMLWRAGFCYQSAGKLADAERLWKRFLNTFAGSDLYLTSAINLGQVLLAQGQPQSSVTVIEDALVVSPRSRDRFAARLLLAKAYRRHAEEVAKQDELDKSATPAATKQSANQANDDAKFKVNELLGRAQSLLESNVDGTQRELEPSAWEWRESAYALADLLELKADFEPAITWYQESVVRFPNDANVIPRKWKLARLQFDHARRLKTKRETEVVQKQQRILETAYQSAITGAEETLQELIDVLAGQPDAPVPVGRAKPETFDRWEILESALLLRAECRDLQGDPISAIDALTKAIAILRHRESGLSAQLRQAELYQRIGKSAESQAVVRQALWRLEQLPESAFTGGAKARTDWRNRLNNLL